MEQENCCGGHCNCNDQTTNKNEEELECCCGGHCACNDTPLEEKSTTNKKQST